MKTIAKNLASIVSTPLIALAALAISATANAQNLITNGSFELGPDGTPDYLKTWAAPVNWVSLGGDTSFGKGGVDYGTTATDGSYLASIGGNASWTAGIKTTWFSLTEGQEYTFSFDAAGQGAYMADWTPVAWEQWKMGLYYTVRYTEGDGGLDGTAAADGAVFPVAINSWTPTSVTFTAGQSGFVTVEVSTYNNGWTPDGYVYSAVDNFKLEAVLTPYQSWAAANAGGQTADLDYDQDGVSNGVEFFMNAAPGFTANPGLDGSNKITWTNGGNIPSSAYGTQFVVQTSTDLETWEDVSVGGLAENSNGPGGSLSYTVTGSGKQFVRLKVTPN
jgi:hypothetical protein